MTPLREEDKNVVCRQLHVLDETFVMNACKEDCCYVALDWAEDVRIAKRKGAENTLARDYVLPGSYLLVTWRVESIPPCRRVEDSSV